MGSDDGRTGPRLGMGNFMSGSIDRVASKRSEEIAGTGVTSVQSGTDGSGHCHRADGVA